MRTILLLLFCCLPLAGFSQQQVSAEYLQSRKEEARKEMKLQLRQYFGEASDDDDTSQVIVPRVPEWIIESIQKQISKFDTLTHCSKEDVAKAEYTLGCYYHEQEAKDAAAVKWFMRAAQFGQRDAQFNIGLIYEYGFHNHQKDIMQAVKWYEKAAGGGSAEAMLNLGTLYYNGKKVKEDFPKGFDYLQRSADKGNVDAMVSLATIYNEGICIPRDVKRAIGYWLEVAEKRNGMCYARVADRYLKGDGVEQDTKKAIQYLMQGYQQGDIDATCLLAHCYCSGQGVQRDYARAYSLIQVVSEEKLWETGRFTPKELKELYTKINKE